MPELNVTFSYCYNECHYTDSRFAECYYAECLTSFWHNNTLNVPKLGTEFISIGRKDETINVVCSHILLGQRSESDWTKMSRDHN